MIKFLLLSPPRTGSQLLLSAMHDPSCSIFNEIFTHNVFVKDYAAHHDANKKFENPCHYIDYFLNGAKTKIAGAKIITSVFPESALKKIAVQPYTFIYLYRTNLFENAISLAVAHMTNVWMLNKQRKDKINQFKNIAPFSIDEEKFERWLRVTLEQTRMCINALQTANAIFVTYENLCGNSGEKINLNVINRVRAHVGLPALKSFDPPFQKQCKDDTYNKILNIKVLEVKYGSMYGTLHGTAAPAIWSSGQ